MCIRDRRYVRDKDWKWRRSYVESVREMSGLNRMLLRSSLCRRGLSGARSGLLLLAGRCGLGGRLDVGQEAGLSRDLPWRRCYRWRRRSLFRSRVARRSRRVLDVVHEEVNAVIGRLADLVVVDVCGRDGRRNVWWGARRFRRRVG